MSNRCFDRMCGASDCGNCHPGADSPVECSECGVAWESWEAHDYLAEVDGEFYCEDCSNEKLANDIFELHELLLGVSKVFNLCDKEQSILDITHKWIKGRG